MRTVVLATVSLVAALVLAACSDPEAAVRDATSDAACSLAREAVDRAGTEAGTAVDEIGADPRAAQQELKAARDVLTVAQKGVSGDVKSKVGDARAAVEELLDEARKAAEGADVDVQLVERARGELDRAIADVRDVC
ncbi:hypothetical protein FE634_06670 [Nocardioides dongxiaopingii]|uniref:hypothetical protein n=1 Tax=Nocardioides TaxID=1839 RepID=UPI0010C765DD|nr:MULTISPECIES: hypothetical protein [Nocardioides]QCW50169.1 hypothetical protein FE634_06670 [Nocardioides sp. S-1144]